MNPELLEAFENFDTGGEANPQPSSAEGTRFRYQERWRQCVAFSSLEEGVQFFVNPRDETHLTRSARPLSRCPRYANTFVWVNIT